jgi:hypothetical protein
MFLFCFFQVAWQTGFEREFLVVTCAICVDFCLFCNNQVWSYLFFFFFDSGDFPIIIFVLHLLRIGQWMNSSTTRVQVWPLILDTYRSCTRIPMRRGRIWNRRRTWRTPCLWSFSNWILEWTKRQEPACQIGWRWSRRHRWAADALVTIHYCIPKASLRRVNGYGLLHRHPIWHAGSCLFVHSNIQLENDQRHGVLHVRLLFHIRPRLIGIRVQLL